MAISENTFNGGKANGNGKDARANMAESIVRGCSYRPFKGIEHFDRGQLDLADAHMAHRPETIAAVVAKIGASMIEKGASANEIRTAIGAFARASGCPRFGKLLLSAFNAKHETIGTASDALADNLEAATRIAEGGKVPSKGK